MQLFLRDQIRETIGRPDWVYYDGRASACNIVHKVGKRLNLGISDKEIAASFGRHSVEVMQNSYLVPEKSTRPIDALNFIRECHDVTGLNENEEVNHFKRHQMILKNIQNNPELKKDIKEKRNSLEILTQEQFIPTQSQRLQSINLPAPNYQDSTPILAVRNLNEIPNQTPNSSKENMQTMAQNSTCEIQSQEIVSSNNENINQTLILTQNNFQISNKRKQCDIIQALFNHQNQFQQQQNMYMERQQKLQFENQLRWQQMKSENQMNFQKMMMETLIKLKDEST